MEKLNWKPIIAEATKAAEQLGHKLLPFGKTLRSPMGAPTAVRTASCADCYGCCWIDWLQGRGHRAGGRILKYKCGTAEAMGMKSGTEIAKGS